MLRSHRDPRTFLVSHLFHQQNPHGTQWVTQMTEEEIPHSRKRDDDTEPEYQDSEKVYEETARADAAASDEEEEEEMKHKSLDLKGKVKRKGFESDEKSPPRKPSTNRRMTVVSDSDED